MLTVQDLQGSAKRRKRERQMRVLFQAAAVASIVISLLIFFVLVRGAINFLRLVDWDFGLLSDTGWFPRRERFDLRTIVVGSVVMGAWRCSWPSRSAWARPIYLSEYAPRRSAGSSSRSSRCWPASRR